MALIFVVLFSFSIQGAETADPTGIETIRVDSTPSVMRESLAKCNHAYALNNCAALRSSLPESERSNVIDCSMPESYVPARIALGVGEGVGAFIWDTAKGVVTLPYELGKGLTSAPGNMANSINEQQKCFNNMEHKKKLLEPIRSFNEGAESSMSRWSCNQIRQYVEQLSQRKTREVTQKKNNQKKYDDFIKQNPEHKDYADREWPREKRELSSQEKAYAESAYHRNRAHGLLPDIIKKLQQTHACYTNQHKAKLAAEIVAATLATGGAGKFLDPKIRALASQFLNQGKVASAAEYVIPKFRTQKELVDFLRNSSDEDFTKFVRARFKENSFVRKELEAGDIVSAREFVSHGNNVARLGQELIAQDAAKAARAAGLGPPLGRISGEDGRLVYRTANGDPVGYIVAYGREKGEMYVKSMVTNPEFAGRGVGDSLLKRVVQDNPGIERYSAELAITNQQAVQQALAAGANCADAVKASPFYKSMNRLGYGRVISATCNGYPTLTLGR